jgi:hypothetical protein
MRRNDPLRPGAIIAILESMRVDSGRRRNGVGQHWFPHYLHGLRKRSESVERHRVYGFAPFDMTLQRAL